jgi:hypothetical protein
MNSITNCAEGVAIKAFRDRQNKALARQKDEGQQTVSQAHIDKADKLRNERVRSAIQNARHHLLDLFVLKFHSEELRQIENMFIDLELKRLEEL